MREKHRRHDEHDIKASKELLQSKVIGAPGGILAASHRYFEFANLEDLPRFPAISDSIGLRIGSE